MVGTRYWAKQALTSVLSSLLAKSMQHLLLHPETARDSPETGALMVVSRLHILLCDAVLGARKCYDGRRAPGAEQCIMHNVISILVLVIQHQPCTHDT